MIVGIIPARFQSSRFPGKPLALIAGKPMIQWVYERCKSFNIFDKLIVATDDQRIFDFIKSIHGEVMMTSSEHLNGTSRCSEVAGKLNLHDSDIVINVQGDEPLIGVEQIQNLQACFVDSETEIGTLARYAESKEEIYNLNRPKVVLDNNRHALYFSRNPIPMVQPAEFSLHNYLIHLGLFAFRFKVLKDVVNLSPTPLEKIENLEQLRWLESGFKIKVGICSENGHGVDTPDDIVSIEKLLRSTE